MGLAAMYFAQAQDVSGIRNSIDVSSVIMRRFEVRENIDNKKACN